MTTVDALDRDEQITGSLDTAFAAQLETRLKDLHTCLPGIIAAFDPDKQTASVQPAVQRVFTEKGSVNLPLCVDVPVQFPGGGDFFLTFPVKPGDECILWFSERAIDYWYAQGQTQPPAEYRLHDFSDGLAMVGLNSQPKNIPAFNSADVELRSRDRSVRVTMKHDGTIENVNPVGNTVLSAAGKFTINAPGGFEVNAPHSQINSASTTLTGTELVQGQITGQAGMAITGNLPGGGGAATFSGDITSTGTVTGNTDVIGGGKSLKTHVHSGVQAGGSNTGAPV